MKTSLHFLSEQDFQNFCSQLFSAEFPTFQAIEGSGGDGGLDGLDRNIAFQMFFPDPKNRTAPKYIEKIDNTLTKLVKTIQEKQLTITQWVFVVPEDLRYEVVIHLQKKGQELGLDCLHWGATKLTELVNKHPHVRDSFPNIFLPDVKEDLGDVKDGIASLGRPRSILNVEVITDREFRDRDQAFDEEYRQQTQGLIQKYGTSSSAHIAASEAYRQQTNKKKRELREKKAASDRSYELERQDVEDHFTELLRAKKDEMAKRGIYNSGIAEREFSLIEQRKQRELEKLQLKYGKEAQA